MAGLGLQTAALAASGHVTTDSNQTEVWDGTSWTEVAETNTSAREREGSGSSVNALVFGGNPGSVNTEFWNGTSWTELNNLATGRRGVGYGRQSNAAQAIAYGGTTAPGTSYVANTEEWTADLANKTITAS
jgi:hypothetical protein